MIIREITLKENVPLHGPAATRFVLVANRYESDIQVEIKGVKGNGKSLLGIMHLNGMPGDTVKLTADGPDEAALIDALVTLNENCYQEYENL